MDVFFVSSLAGVKEAGVFAAAQLFALLPQLLGIYMAAVFSPKVLPMWRKGELGPVYRKYLWGLLALAVAGYAGALLLVGILGDRILPESYREAAPVILLLLPAGLSAFVAFPWTIPFLLYARPKLLLFADCLSLPLLIFAYSLAIPRFGIRGAALVTSAFGLLRTGFYLLLAQRILRDDPEGREWSARPGFGNSMQLAGSST
jgi:O-antigen/teichoic acid export membrane protein